MPQLMNTGDVTRRMGVTVTSERLLELGFKPVEKDKRAYLWDQADYPEMCEKFGAWIIAQKDVPMQPKPARTSKAPSEPAKSKPATYDTDDL
jgi:hypothetical protein